MAIFLITFLVLTLVVAGMAVGVMFGRKPIQGSCGGLNKIKGLECACSQPCEKRRRALGLAADD